MKLLKINKKSIYLLYQLPLNKHHNTTRKRDNYFGELLIIHWIIIEHWFILFFLSFMQCYELKRKLFTKEFYWAQKRAGIINGNSDIHLRLLHKPLSCQRRTNYTHSNVFYIHIFIVLLVSNIIIAIEVIFSNTLRLFFYSTIVFMGYLKKNFNITYQIF